jgi:hypothetical protein
MHGRHLFDISHKGRNISMMVSSLHYRKRYIGSINGEVCAIGSCKGDVMRQLMELAPLQPKAEKPPAPQPRRRKFARPLAAPPWKSR